MPLTRPQKEKVVTKLGENISGATSVVFLSFDALNVEDVNALRDQLHAAGCGMNVVPKRLLNLVMRNAKLDFKPLEQPGQLAVIWGPDPVTPAKTIYEFAKKHGQIQLLAGTLEKELISLEQVNSLAQIPSREQLLGQLVGVLAAPMRGLVGALTGVPRAMVFVLKAIADQKK